MQARLIFNALVHQYLIPGAEVGAKVTVDTASGDILDVFTVSRPITPDSGCLRCNGLISAARLQEEALTEGDRTRQRYVEDATVSAPSVVSLNAVAAAHAVNDYLFAVTGLLNSGVEHHWLQFWPRESALDYDLPAKDPHCGECSESDRSRLGAGDNRRLPTRIDA
jgi:hypothetical protein